MSDVEQRRFDRWNKIVQSAFDDAGIELKIVHMDDENKTITIQMQQEP